MDLYQNNFTNLTLRPMGLIKYLCSNIFLILPHICFLQVCLSSLRFFILFLLDAGFQALIQYNSRQEAVEAFGSLHVILYDTDFLGLCIYILYYSILNKHNIPGKKHIWWLLPARHSIFKVWALSILSNLKFIPLTFYSLISSCFLFSNIQPQWTASPLQQWPV